MDKGDKMCHFFLGKINSMITISSEEQLEEIIQTHSAVLVYFSSSQCAPCKVLKPRIEEMCTEDYHNLLLCSVDCDDLREIASQNRVFTTPVVIVFFNGYELIRKSRVFGVRELSEAISRPYLMMFE